MSACAVTPETYAAWRYLETGDEELHERDEAEMARGEEELGLLLTGTNVFASRHEVDVSSFLTLWFSTKLQTSKRHRQSQNSNYTSSDYSSSSVSHNDPLLVNWSGTNTRTSASSISKSVRAHSCVLARRRKSNDTWRDSRLSGKRKTPSWRDWQHRSKKGNTATPRACTVSML